MAAEADRRRGSVLDALIRTPRDLADPQLRPVLLAVAGWSAGLFALAAVALFAGFAAPGAWAAARLAWAPAWLADALAFALAAAVFAALAWLAFAAVAQTVASFHLDAVVACVERRHYPQLGPGRGGGPLREAMAALRFFVLLLALNAAALPFYLVGLALPPVAVAAFYLVNGYLFGREYADAVIGRRLPPAEAAAWRRARRGRLWLAGAAIAFAMTLPVLNLLGPVAAAVFMTHVCHGSQRQG